MINFNGKKILVTGATGFIGSHLVVTLEKLGARIFAISRQEKPSGSITYFKGNLAHLDFVNKVFEEVKPEIVYHLASEVTGSREFPAVQTTFSGILQSSLNIFQACITHKAQRVVYTGSLEEADAENNYQAVSPYSAAKSATTLYANLMFQLYQLPVVRARLYMVYGPNQFDRKKIIPYVIDSYKSKEAPKLSSGLRPVDWIYVGDVVSGLLQCGRVEGIEGKSFDLGSGTLVTIRDVIEQIAQIMNPELKPLFGALPDRPMEKIQKANIAGSQELLHWSPNITLSEGLKNTIEADLQAN